MKNTSSRNYTLDFVKGIACIFVVFMHCEFPGYLGTLVQCVARFCVPLFFMVSGYFCFKKSGTVDYKKKVGHIGMITLFASVFYIIIALITNNISFSFKALLKWIVFNSPMIVAGQMWFLFALLYDYILFGVIEKFKLTKFTAYAVPVCTVLYIALAQGAHLVGIPVQNMIYRNFLIEGMLFFCLGYWLHRKEDKFKFDNKILLAVFIIATLLCPVERVIMGRDFGVNIVTFPQVTALFLLCTNNGDKFKNSKLTVLGNKYSLFVYVLHPAVWHALGKLYSVLGISDNTIALYCMPILCAGFAILAALIANGLNVLIKKRKKV